MTFTTAINCMDGRVQLPVIQYIKEKYGPDYVDMITEAGPDGLLKEGKQTEIIKNIFSRVSISLNRHNTHLIIILGHDDCAGFPVSKKEHIAAIETSANILHKKFPKLHYKPLKINVK